MSVRKTENDIVRIVISARAVPVGAAGVRRKLDHAKRQDGTGKCMSMPAGADERVYPPGVIVDLLAVSSRQAVKDQQNKSAQASQPCEKKNGISVHRFIWFCP